MMEIFSSILDFISRETAEYECRRCGEISKHPVNRADKYCLTCECYYLKRIS